jgi:vacuolar-type H+-ATPase subunit H
MSIPGADVQTKLDEIVALVEAAKSGALSTTTVKIDRAELLAALDELRELLPREISDARALLRRRDDIIGEASSQASGIIAAARTERDRLIEETEVLRAAGQQAAEVLADADHRAALMRAEVDEYADGRLAAFESALTKTLVQVQHGRDKLRGNLPSAPEQIDLRDAAPEQVPPQEINVPVG